MIALREILGQPRAVSALSRALVEDRLSPALVFHGPAGVGKLATALALARALLCPGGGCGSCAVCRRIDERALVHPSVRAVFPETVKAFEKGAAGDTEDRDQGPATSGVDLQDRQAEAARNPAWTILIDRVRQSIGFLQRRPPEGARSILIIDQAQRMPAEAANALLKTLEEPPPHAVLILLSASWHALLPTIRSRAQAVPFQLVPRIDLAAVVADRLGVGAEEAALRAGLAGGRIGAAIDLDLEAFRRRREELLALLEAVVRRGDPGIAVKRAEDLSAGGDRVEADLEILMSLIRDLMIADTTGAGPGDLVHVDFADRLAPLAPFHAGRWGAALEALETTLGAIRRRGHRQLLLENFLLGLVAPPAGAAGASRAT